MPKKPKKPRKEPAEKVLIIDEWDKWVKGKIPKGEKGTDMQGLEFHAYLGRGRTRRATACRSRARWARSIGSIGSLTRGFFISDTVGRRMRSPQKGTGH
jgi:hypothetical protein